MRLRRIDVIGAALGVAFYLLLFALCVGSYYFVKQADQIVMLGWFGVPLTIFTVLLLPDNSSVGLQIFIAGVIGLIQYAVIGYVVANLIRSLRR